MVARWKSADDLRHDLAFGDRCVNISKLVRDGLNFGDMGHDIMLWLKAILEESLFECMVVVSSILGMFS